MKRFIGPSIVLVLALVALLGPSLSAHAQGLVPCQDTCGFNDLLTLGNNVIDFLIFKVAAPIAAVSFAIAGFMYMTARGNPSQHEKAKSIFVSVFIGFVIALSAWLVVKFIVISLVNPSVFDISRYLGS